MEFSFLDWIIFITGWLAAGVLIGERIWYKMRGE